METDIIRQLFVALAGSRVKLVHLQDTPFAVSGKVHIDQNDLTAYIFKRGRNANADFQVRIYRENNFVPQEVAETLVSHTDKERIGVVREAFERATN